MSESSDPESLNLPYVPKMGAEAGYELNESAAPLRVTGFLALLLGLLSIAALVGQAALLIPIASLLFGIVALRRHGAQVPVGIVPAKIGIVLAIFFGSCGFFTPWMKSMTLGEQAEKFARDYIKLVARDEAEMAHQLQRDYYHRFPNTMPLKAHYELTQPKTPEGEDVLVEFRRESINETIVRRGENAEWKLRSPVRIHTSRGVHKAEMVFIDPTGIDNVQMLVVLEYRLDENGNIQWRVGRVQSHGEAIYAEQVL